MADFLLPNFLSDRAEHDQAEHFWSEQFRRITREEGVSGEWKHPWFNMRFGNGMPFGDGNPIFSAWSQRRRIGLRVIQHPPADLSEIPEFESWLSVFDPDGQAVAELVVSCVLSIETGERAAQLIRPWVAYGRILVLHPGPEKTIIPRPPSERQLSNLQM